jgi:hypothetical protein
VLETAARQVLHHLLTQHSAKPVVRGCTDPKLPSTQLQDTHERWQCNDQVLWIVGHQDSWAPGQSATDMQWCEIVLVAAEVQHYVVSSTLIVATVASILS